MCICKAKNNIFTHAPTNEEIKEITRNKKYTINIADEDGDIVKNIRITKIKMNVDGTINMYIRKQ